MTVMRRTGLVIVVLPAMLIGLRLGPMLSAPREPQAASSLAANTLLNPQDLEKALQPSKSEKPLTLFVGFPVLYAQAHIPSSEDLGPASRAEFLEKLRKRVEPLSRSKLIVLYCGCCPWDHCPNVRPAYEALHGMGFKNLKVLYLPNDFGQDWVNKGFPLEKGRP